MIGWLKGLAERWDPRSQLTEKDISPYFWPNGTMPSSAEFDGLVADGFAHYRLRVSGLVEAPQEFSLADLKAMPKQEQITTHFCIQGWSGVAKWGGVPMRHILDLVRPTAEARYAVFYSLADGADGGRYYDVHKMYNMRHELTILAYEMNGAPAQRAARRAAAAALRERARLQDGQMDRGDRVRARLRRPRRRPGRLQRGSRVLRLPHADLRRCSGQSRSWRVQKTKSRFPPVRTSVLPKRKNILEHKSAG